MAMEKGAKGKGGPDQDVLLANLQQMKVLADPRRLRILELLCEERTTKQVAEILGEPPTRLYHHVAALERVGLVRLARTRQRRGALEKYYLAVAKAFSADPRLFTSRRAPQAAAAAQSLATQALDLTGDDLRALLAEEGASLKGLKDEGILTYLEVRGTRRQIQAIRKKLVKLIEGVAKEGQKGRDEARYRLTIAFFPMPRRSSSG